MQLPASLSLSIACSCSLSLSVPASSCLDSNKCTKCKCLGFLQLQSIYTHTWRRAQTCTYTHTHALAQSRNTNTYIYSTPEADQPFHISLNEFAHRWNKMKEFTFKFPDFLPSPDFALPLRTKLSVKYVHRYFGSINNLLINQLWSTTAMRCKVD